MAELASRFSREHEVHVFANKWEKSNGDNIVFHWVPAITWRELTKVLSFIVPATFMAPKGFDIIHSQGLCGVRHDLTTTHFIQTAWINELRRRGSNLGFATFLWEKIVAPLEKYALGPSCSRAVIGISKSVISDLNTEYGIKDNIHLIYHGVDLQKFHPSGKIKFRSDVRQSLNISSSEFMALFVGNLKKGASAAIRAISLVPGAKLVLVSGSNNSDEKKVAAEQKVEDRVLWISKSREVEKYFAAADCFVFPTVYEPFGMVISEAMASGIPVITSRSAGAAELIEDGVSGWLVDEPWDFNFIANKMNELKNKPEYCEAMGNNARKAVEKYSWDLCATETMKLYQSIISGRVS